MQLDRTGPPMKNLARRRGRVSWLGTVALLALMAPLAGCGATGNASEAAGGKAGGSVPAEPVVLRMLNPTGAPESQDFVSAVEKISNGQLRIEVVDEWRLNSGGDLTSEHDAIDAVRAGNAPLGITAVRAWHDQGIRSFDALIAPLVIDRPAVQGAVLHSDIATDMLTGLNGSGMTGIGILPGPMRHPVGITRDLKGPSDYQGAVIATPPSVVVERSLETLGAIPTKSGFNGAPVDTFDGIDQQLSSVAGNQYDAAAKSATTNVTLGPRPLVIYGNSAALAGLSEQNRTFLIDAARATVDIKAANDRATEAEDVGFLCRRGLIAFEKASPTQVQALRDKLQPLYQWLREDTATAEFLDRIAQLADSVPVDSVSDAPIECPDANRSAGATASPTPIDGTYTTTSTLDDLKAAGIPASAWVPENYGDSVYVYDRGRFATTQHNDEACTWAYGRYSVAGDVLTWDFEGGGGQAPTNAANKPGEEFGFHWSLYRDVLTLTKMDGMISPLMDGNQWKFQRVSATPDPSALNQQCPPPAAAFLDTPH